ncbi:MAG: hypothetical protein HY329_10040 [Chloroflexi bacterium]|nr:hypothetical protein [Chloroflexota bacterium]
MLGRHKQLVDHDEPSVPSDVGSGSNSSASSGLFRASIYLVWALIWTTAGALLVQLVPPLLAGPPSATGSITEEIVSVEAPYCSGGCLGLAEWRTLADHPALVSGLALAYHTAPELRPIAQVATSRRARVTVRPTRFGGEYELESNTVVVNLAALSDGGPVIAALAAHELVHAGSSSLRLNTREGAADCLEEELQAYALQSSVWLKVRRGAGRSVFARRLDEIAAAWQGKRLKELFRSWSLYEQVCLGRELHDY